MKYLYKQDYCICLPQIQKIVMSEWVRRALMNNWNIGVKTLMQT